MGVLYYLGADYSESDARMRTGLNIAGKYEINEQMRVGINLGYYFKSQDGFRMSTTPITVLFDYRFSTSKFSPYAGLDFGIYRTAFSYNGESIGDSNIGFAPVFGFDYELSEKININGNLKYNQVFTKENGYGNNTSFLGVNLGLSYKL